MRLVSKRVVSKRRCSASAKLAVAAAIVIASGAAPALAQDAVEWQCSADNGSYSENPLPVASGVRTITGRIQFHAGAFGERWSPKAVIAFTDSRLAAGRDCFCNGIRASIHPSEPNTVKFFMIANGRSTGFAQAEVGIPITFKVSVNPSGVMTAVIGKSHPQVQTAQLAHPRRDTVHMSCSSGDVSFRNLWAG